MCQDIEKRYICIENRGSDAWSWVFKTGEEATAFAKKLFLEYPKHFQKDYDVYTIMVTRDDLYETAFDDDGAVIDWNDYEDSEDYDGDFTSRRYLNDDDIAWMTIADTTASGDRPFLANTGAIDSDAAECTAIPGMKLFPVYGAGNDYTAYLYTTDDLFGGHRLYPPYYWDEPRDFRPVVLSGTSIPGCYEAYTYHREPIPDRPWSERVVRDDRLPGVWRLYTRQDFITSFYHDGVDGITRAVGDADEDAIRYLSEVIALAPAMGGLGGLEND